MTRLYFVISKVFLKREKKSSWKKQNGQPPLLIGATKCCTYGQMTNFLYFCFISYIDCYLCLAQTLSFGFFAPQS